MQRKKTTSTTTTTNQVSNKRKREEPMTPVPNKRNRKPVQYFESPVVNGPNLQAESTDKDWKIGDNPNPLCREAKPLSKITGSMFPLRSKKEKKLVIAIDTNGEFTSHKDFPDTYEEEIIEKTKDKYDLRPIVSVERKTVNESPLEVKTPNGKIYERAKRFGPKNEGGAISFYSEKMKETKNQEEEGETINQEDEHTIKAKRKLNFGDQENDDVFDCKDNQSNINKEILKFTQSSFYDEILAFKNEVQDKREALSNENELKEKTKKSKPATQIVKFFDADVKTQSMTITPDSIQYAKTIKSQYPYRVNENGKCTDQKSVMGISADDYVETIASLDLKNVPWEWLHLICYSMLGPFSQKPINLVAGTFDANTDMMLIESLLPYLSQHYPNGFELNVKAYLVKVKQETSGKEEYYHIATEIDYEVKAGNDFNILINFDAQTEVASHESFMTAFKAYVETHMKLFKRNPEKTTEAEKVKEKENKTHATLDSFNHVEKNNRRYVYFYKSNRGEKEVSKGESKEENKEERKEERRIYTSP